MSQLPPQIKQNKQITPEQAKAALWRKGVLKWKLDKNQLEMYQFATQHQSKILVIGASRRIGKSFFLVTLAIEQCLKQPYSIVKYVSDQVGTIKKIIAPLMREILADCPDNLRPSYRTLEHIFRFKNGSEIQLAGSANGHAENIRGNKANLCIVDEAGFCDDLDYVVNSILLPTTLTTNGKIVLASTPSKSIDHDFVRFMRQAELEGRFIKKTIYDNPRLTQNEIDRMAESLGGKDSVAFKREFMAELITSTDDAIVPEFKKELKEQIVRCVEKPAYYDSYVAMDIGVKDLTVVLFAHYNFNLGKIIIEDELVLSGPDMLTDKLADLIRNKEASLWKNSMGDVKPPILRVADNNNPILLNDLTQQHGLAFFPTHKDNSEAQLANMRRLLQNQQIIIDPRCRILISHLETGVWNKARTSYLRSSDKGHFDAIDALKYLCRNINFTRNPFPDHYRYSPSDAMLVEKQQQAKNPLERTLTNMFKVRRRF